MRRTWVFVGIGLIALGAVLGVLGLSLSSNAQAKVDPLEKSIEMGRDRLDNPSPLERTMSLETATIVDRENQELKDAQGDLRLAHVTRNGGFGLAAIGALVVVGGFAAVPTHASSSRDAAPTAKTVTTEGPGDATIESRLRRVDGLLENRQISQAERDEKRRAILDDL